MLEMLLCLLSCAAVGGLGSLSEGARIQVTSADLSTVLATGHVEHGDLRLDADLEPLANVVLIISSTPPAPTTVQNVSSLRSSDIVSLSGFISPSAHDIMVQEPSGTVSLRDWLKTQNIVLNFKD